MAACKTISERVKVTERTIRKWVEDFELVEILRDSKRGKHSKTISPMDNPDFKAKFKEYVKTNSRKPGKLVGGWVVGQDPKNWIRRPKLV